MKNLLFMTLLATSFAALAQAGNTACQNDVEQFCKSQKSTPSATMDCLLDHQQDISNACYDSLKQRLDNQRNLKACKADAEQFCSGVQAGGGRIVRCLSEHQKEISDDCYDLLSKKMSARGSR